MYELSTAIPDADVVLALSPEELGGRLLFLLKQRLAAGTVNPAGFHLANLISELGQYSGRDPPYGHKTEQIQGAVCEAFAWLEANVLLVSAWGTNGSNGWRFLSRRAQEIVEPLDFARYRAAAALPKDHLHKDIAEKVWLSFVRGEYDTAAFQAMRQVEIAIREATKIDALGVTLARRAFKPKDSRTGEVGPLTDQTAENGEQHCIMDLFAGALGAMKNPHSHRIVNLDNPAEGVAVVLFASQLLRIIENRVGRSLANSS